jgi:hypothetical protein
MRVRHGTIDPECHAQATALKCWTDINHSAIRFQLTKFRLTKFFNKFGDAPGNDWPRQRG